MLFLCCAEKRDERAITAVAARLEHGDFGVRRAAVNALYGIAWPATSIPAIMAIPCGQSYRLHVLVVFLALLIYVVFCN